MHDELEADEREADQFLGRFRKRETPTSAEIFENELTELYRSTLATYEPETNLCVRCGKKVERHRVSDGVQVWHPGCY